MDSVSDQKSGVISATKGGTPQWNEVGGYYRIVRHADVLHICMNPDTFSSNLVAFMLSTTNQSAQLFELPPGTPKPVDVLAIADPPIHTQERKLLNPEFNGRQLKSYEEGIRSQSQRLLQTIRSQNEIEWMEDYAIPLPLLTIASILGLPSDHLPKLRQWSDAGVSLVNGSAKGEDLPTMASAIIEFQSYLSDHLSNATSGLLKKMKSMVTEEASLSHDEAVSILLQLVIAGSESTSSLLGSIALQLATNPDWVTKLQATPTLKAAFIDEMVRLEPPFKGHFRVVKKETQLRTLSLKVGDRLMLDWEEANKDPEVFDAPSLLNPARPELRKHLGFGHGIHRCLGASLAKLEAQIALDEFLDHFADASTPEAFTPSYLPSVFTRRLEKLPLQRKSVVNS